MAESVVTFLIEKLEVFLSSEVRLIRGVDGEIRLLQYKLQWLQAFLKDADVKRRDNNLIKVWVGQIRDLSYDVEDVIDEYSYKILKARQRPVGFLGSLCNYVSCPRQLNTLHELGSRIVDFKTKFEVISNNRSEFGIEIMHTKGEASSSSSSSLIEHERVPPIVEETNVVGFEQDTKALKEKLLDGDARRTVITIVGMGGLGKTTLARKVYNNTDVKRHFDCQVWIYVSQKYSRRELLQGVLDCTVRPNKKEIIEMTEQDMMNMVKDYLRDKKYLLVIDDIWDGAAWDSICDSLPDEMKGSRIMLTTRIKDVGVYVELEGLIHELQCLNEKESWELFCSKAFPLKTGYGCPSELESIGREMVRKCCGLPLALVVLGGLLLRKPKTQNEWSYVLKAIKHELHEKREGQGVKNILTLSYDHLPHYLKPCFLYFGLFLEDFEISGKRLVHLWVSEGFIQKEGDRTMEEIGEHYLEELIARCMIQVVSRDTQGRAKKCRIHDMLLDLAILEGKEEKFLGKFIGDAADAQSGGSRRLSIQCGTTGVYGSSYHSISGNLRSLLCFERGVEESLIKDLINRLKLLRVVDIKWAFMRRLPKQIGELVHLRYFRLKGESLAKLPSSVGNLCNLQFLQVGYCTVPKDVWKIEGLRHVSGGPVESPTGRVNCKSSLQTLWGVIGGSWVGNTLGELTNLRRLRIRVIRESHVVGLVNSLEKLTRLNSLRLRMECGAGISAPMLHALSNHDVLYELEFRVERWRSTDEPTPSYENLRLPPNLVKVTLEGTRFPGQEQLALLEGLPCLQILRLWGDAYVGTEMVCSTGGFPQLRELVLDTLKELEEWRIEEGAMPCLNRLGIRFCPGLKMLPEGLKHITTLQELVVRDMPPEFRRRLCNQDGEDRYKVRHVPAVTVEWKSIWGPDVTVNHKKIWGGL